MAFKHLLTLENFHQAPVAADPAFTRWFGTSKITLSGKPRVCYHGTTHKFDAFHSSWAGRTDDGFYGEGFYFATENEYAQEYGKYVVKAYVKLENPFYLPASGGANHPSFYDLRDALAALKGGNPELKTTRTIPAGWHLEEEEKDHPYFPGKTYTSYCVYPDPERWDDDDDPYLYGRDRESALEAIISFHDARNEVDFNVGWASALVKYATTFAQRQTLTQLLQGNGYDGVVVYDPDHTEHNDKRVTEIVAFEPTQIKSVDNDGTWDDDDPSMFS